MSFGKGEPEKCGWCCNRRDGNISMDATEVVYSALAMCLTTNSSPERTDMPNMPGIFFQTNFCWHFHFHKRNDCAFLISLCIACIIKAPDSNSHHVEMNQWMNRRQAKNYKIVCSNKQMGAIKLASHKSMQINSGNLKDQNNFPEREFSLMTGNFL